MGAAPDGVELLHDFCDKFGIGGDDAGFKVATVVGLGAHACAGEIGRAGVGEAAVNDDGFEMYARAEDALNTVDKGGVSVKILTEGRAGLFGMEQADGDLSLDEVGKDFQEGNHAAAFIDVQVFEVAGAEPDKFLRPGDFRQDYPVIDFAIGNEITLCHVRNAPLCFRPYGIQIPFDLIREIVNDIRSDHGNLRINLGGKVARLAVQIHTKNGRIIE